MTHYRRHCSISIFQHSAFHHSPAMEIVTREDSSSVDVTASPIEGPPIDKVAEAVAQLRLSPSTAPADASVVSGIEVAAAVLTNPLLLSVIGSFQQDPVGFVATYKKMVLGQKRVKRDSSKGHEGSLVQLAITRWDMYALKMLFMARLRSPAVAMNNEVSFRYAMSYAVKEDRLEIIQWLLEKSQQHPREFKWRPDTHTIVTMLRESRMHAVRCLLDRYQECFWEVLTGLLHRSPQVVGPHCCENCSNEQDDWALSLLQLFVQQHQVVPSWHDKLLLLAAEAGSVSAVSYMLSSRSGIDTSAMVMLPSMLAAARGGHRELAEMLLAAKSSDEVVTVAVLRESLCGLGDAGALQLLLSVAAQREPLIQQQLDTEQNAANTLFGGRGLSTSSGRPTKRRTALKTKAGRR